MLSVLLLISPTLLLTGCGQSPVQPVEVIQQQVPASLTEPTPVPPFIGHTFGDAVEYIPACVAAIQQCNADKATIRSINGPDRTE
ncbi:Rz1-like lysis system protein LysC [Marinobacterium stanieri]|uniref:Rz1-like lysis system protein LysC n=1 Tax=Marinobacterium stanieri TaxID=49186 RepID=UPI003B43A23E